MSERDFIRKNVIIETDDHIRVIHLLDILYTTNGIAVSVSGPTLYYIKDLCRPTEKRTANIYALDGWLTSKVPKKGIDIFIDQKTPTWDTVVQLENYTGTPVIEYIKIILKNEGFNSDQIEEITNFSFEAYNNGREYKYDFIEHIRDFIGKYSIIRNKE